MIVCDMYDTMDSMMGTVDQVLDNVTYAGWLYPVVETNIYLICCSNLIYWFQQITVDSFLTVIKLVGVSSTVWVACFDCSKDSFLWRITVISCLQAKFTVKGVPSSYWTLQICSTTYRRLIRRKIKCF